MKKTLALILSILALLIPVSAIELDVAEGADVAAVEAEANLLALPELTHETYGDLIYFTDMDEYGQYINKDVVGNSANIFSYLGYVTEGNWGANYVDDPAGVNGKVHKLTVSDSYNGNYAGIYIEAHNVALENIQATVVMDVYFPEEAEETFRIQYTGGSSIVSVPSADYTGSGTWQTIVIPVPKAPFTFDSKVSFNALCGATPGTVYYIDNVRLYTKELAYAAKPATVDASKGFLVYFENGNDADAYSNLNASAIGGKNLYNTDGYYTKDIADTASVQGAATYGLGVGTGDNATTFAYADGTDMDGNITVVFEMFNVNASDLGFYHYVRGPKVTNNWCNGYTSWAGAKAIANQWTTITTSGSTEHSFIGRARTAASGQGDLRYRSIYVYYMPKNRVTVDGTLVDLTGKTEYTLPAFDTADYDSYKDADGNVFVPGTYAVADINGKVLTPYLQPEYSAKPADETNDGFLVYFFNGKDSDLVKKVNIKLNKNTLKESTFVNNHYLRGFDCTLTGCATHAGYIIAEDGEGFKFTDGTAVEGDFFVVWEVYSSTGTTVNDFVICDHCTWDGSWIGGIETNWQGVTPASGEWTKIKRSHHANKGVTTIGIIETGWNMSSHMGEQGYGSVAVYYRPQYRVSLTDGTAKNMYDLNGETTYTLPAEYNGNAVEAWKVDGVVYLAGAEVVVADINGKTFEAADADEYYAVYAPEAEGVEMRLTANTAKNGIRFKAALAPSKKAEANEAGFIVARADVLEKIGQDLTFDLSYEGVANAEGTLFVKGVAYNKAEGKNIVAETLADGSEVYTGVCVGMDIENKAHVTSTLVARPYVKLGVAGNEITVYGAEQSASLYELVSAVKETEAYEGAKQYIDTVIATAEAN